MEVHAHSHTPRKKWTHYFWEFLMLFLAVFCGFLAENQREHIVEHQREKQFIKSFIEDLKTDTAGITFYIAQKGEKKIVNDSLIWYLSAPDIGLYTNRIYFFARQLTRTYNFFPAD